MCSFFGVEMENYQGDLTDIVRGSSGGQIGCNNSSLTSASASTASASVSDIDPLPTWQFPSDPVSYFSSIDDHHRDNLFGDPFSNVRDPLLHELNITNSPAFYNPPNRVVVDDAAANININMNNLGGHHQSGGVYHHHEDELKSPCNIFSRIQISSPPPPPSSQSPKTQLQQPALSPCDSPVVMAAASPRGIKAPVMVTSDMINANSSKSCLVDNTAPGQISSPRNLGIKRRSELFL